MFNLIITIEVQPFYLYALPTSLKHLCPVRAYADWINLTQITEGYIFRKMGSGDRISANPGAQLVCCYSESKPSQLTNGARARRPSLQDSARISWTLV